MPKRGENIRKRKDGRWEGRYKEDFFPSVKYRSVYGKTYSEVKTKLYAAKTDKNANMPVLQNQKKISFESVLSLWLSQERIAHKRATDSKYDFLIQRHILPELGKMAVCDIDYKTLNNFMNQKLECGRLDKKGGLSASYVRTIMIIVDEVMRFATEEDYCPPLRKKIGKPPLKQKKLDILSNTQQIKFESYLAKALTPTNLGILLSLNAGLRIGEVCSLRWDDVDFTERELHIRSTVSRIKSMENLTSKTKLIIDKPKTKSSERDIPISEKLMTYLRQVYSKSVSPYVVSDTLDFVNPRTFENRYKKTLKDCGIKKINYHALRHSFATRCIEAGVDVKSLSEILGHSNVSITLNTYVHSSMELKRAQLEKLDILGA